MATNSSEARQRDLDNPKMICGIDIIRYITYIIRVLFGHCMCSYSLVSSLDVVIIQHIETETKWPLFSRRHFGMHFLER